MSKRQLIRIYVEHLDTWIDLLLPSTYIEEYQQENIVREFLANNAPNQVQRTWEIYQQLD